MRIGFVGLGNMGMALALRLVESGFSVIGSDRNADKRSEFAASGATVDADPIAVARQSDILCVCVRTDAQLEVLAGDGMLFGAMRPESLFILNSTVAPDLARRLADMAAAQDVAFVDVGVAGGVAAAAAGTLALHVGGGDAAVERARPILAALGTATHLGPVGRGLEGKLLNNLAAIAQFGMAAAVLDMGAQLDFDPVTLRQALMLGSARGFALEMMPHLLAWDEPMAPRNFERIRDILVKDVQLAAELVAPDNPQRAALVASAQAMIDRLDRVPVHAA